MNSITCENCSQTYNTSDAFCPNCAQANRYYEKPSVQASGYIGSPSGNSYQSANPPNASMQPSSTEGDTSIYWIIGFLFWFVGIILYFALLNKSPKAAQSALNGSLTTIVIGILIVFLASF